MRLLFTLLYAFFIVNCSSISGNKNSPTSIRCTAYTHSESDHIKYGRKTAIGTNLKENTSATDWSIFPVGTKLKFAGNVYEVSDYGSGLIKPESTIIPTVDVYVASKSAMREWGVRFFEDAEIIEFGSYEESLAILKQRLKYQHCREMYNRIQVKL
jgi:3D (Asp-Asp-Asp) domain-containing protein